MSYALPDVTGVAVRKSAIVVGALLTLFSGKVWSTVHPLTPKAPVVRSPVSRSVQQLVLVTAKGWTSATGSLARFERNRETDRWREVGEAIPVNLGRRGLAWGRGLHESPKTGPAKREGDGRSPAGAFELGRAFGEAESLPQDAHAFPYLRTTSATYCVEDVRSEHYNQLVDSTVTKTGRWERWSPLLRSDGLFRWGVVVRQNTLDTVVGAGSCVFLHIWRGPDQPTSGCTAMEPRHIEELLRWLNPEARPLLVQLPEPEYQNVRDAWALP